MSSGYLSEKDFHRAMMRHLKPGRCHKCLERLTEISMLEAQRETYIIWGDKLDRMADLEEKRVVAVERRGGSEKTGSDPGDHLS
nr:unnamed protein product [Haemonchus contortus]